MKLGIRGKLLVPSILLIVVGIGVLVLVSFMESKKALESTVIEDLQKTILTSRQEIDDWLLERKTDAKTWSASSYAREIVANSPEATAKRMESNNFFKMLVEQYPYYQSVNIMDLHGDVIASSDPAKIGKLNLADREYFKQALQGEIVLSEPLVSRATNKLFFAVAAPVYYRNPETGQENIGGVYYAPIDVTTFNGEFMARLKDEGGGYGFSYMPDGNFVSHPDETMIMNEEKKLSTLSFGPEMMSKQEGVVKYVFNNQHSVAAFTKLENANWSIAAKRVTDIAFAKVDRLKWLSVGLGIILVVLMSGVIFLLVNPFVKGIKSTTEMLREIAQGDGDLTARLDVRSDDEIGELAENFNEFVEKLQHSIITVADNTLHLNQTSESLSAVAHQMAGEAEEMTNSSSTVAAAAEQISANVNNITRTSEAMLMQVGTIASSTEQMSAGVNAVATAIEEMSSSLQEVSKNTARASQIADNANSNAKAAEELIAQLDSAAREIGKVVSVISDIADQTNLLALNATIEAASAGDAGKGFAVVANEVKELAKQTAHSTEEITQQINDIQSKTNKAVLAVKQITEVIKEIDTITNTIATAVEEQTATTNEISRSVAGSAEGASEVSKNVQVLNQNIEQEIVRAIKETATSVDEVARSIQEVNVAANDTAKGAATTNKAVDQMATLAGQLQQVVGQFKV